MIPTRLRPGKEALPDALLAAGMGLIVAAAAMLHLALGLAAAGAACVALALGIARQLERERNEPRD